MSMKTASTTSALIAAERLSRRCFAMDIEPRYVQIALERWQAYTGQQAVNLTLSGDGAV